MAFGFLAICAPGLGVVPLFDFWSHRLRRRNLRRLCTEIGESSIPSAVGDGFARLWCVNRPFLRTFGLPDAHEVHGRWLFEFLDDTERCAEIYRCLRTGRTWGGFLFARRRGAALSLELYARVVPCSKTGFVRWTFLARWGTPARPMEEK